MLKPAVRAFLEGRHVARLSVIDAQLSDPGLAEIFCARGYSVESIFHLFESTEALCRVIDAASKVRGIVGEYLSSVDADLPPRSRNAAAEKSERPRMA